MAEIRLTPGVATHEYNVQSWMDMKSGDVGAAFPAIDYNLAAFQLIGDVIDVHVAVEGRLSGSAKFVTLEDDDGFPTTLSQHKITRISKLIVSEIRVTAGSGAGVAAFSVAAIFKR